MTFALYFPLRLFGERVYFHIKESFNVIFQFFFLSVTNKKLRHNRNNKDKTKSTRENSNRPNEVLLFPLHKK